MRKHKWTLISVLVFFSIRQVADAVLRPLYFKKIIDIISLSGPDHSSIAPDIFRLVFIIIALNIIVLLLARSVKYLYLDFQINMMRQLRNFAFSKIEEKSYTFFANMFAGSLVTKARRFVYSFADMFDIFMYSFLNVFITLVGVFVVLAIQSKLISLIFILWVIIHVGVVAFFVKRKMKYDILEAEQDSRISGRLADVFSNINAVKFFSARDNEIYSFGNYTEEGAKRSMKASMMGLQIDIIQGVFICVVQSIILYVMIRLWLQGEITTGTVILVQTYLIIVFDKVWDFCNSLTRFMKLASDMKELVDVFEIPPEIKDPENPEKLKITEGHIIFKDVSFTYHLGEEVMSNFNLDIRHGERVGVVGHSGAGKSTLTKLLLRLNDVIKGSITIDGQDIRNIAQDDLRRVISYVPQEPILFHRPIRENIAYGKPDATMEEIIAVAKKAHAHEFVSRLPHGYDTLVGERGVKLSGGERQRIAIARAMLKDSPILMLDEATSSLDSVSESFIQDAFNELMKGKTTIVIAHRLSTIQKMDRIIVLDQGKIKEEGTHKELLAKGGSYAELWNHQTGFLE
jgi:ATP-binding cassette subfamily B protein